MATTDLATLLDETLMGPPHTLTSRVNRAVRRAWPDRAVMEVFEDTGFDVDVFLERRPCEVTVHQEWSPETRCRTGKIRGPLDLCFVQGHRSLTLDGLVVDVVQVAWQTVIGNSISMTLFVSDEEEALETFVRLVRDVVAGVEAEVLVYSAHWKRDKELFDAIRGSSFDDLVLPEDRASEMLGDCQAFFASKDTYASFGIDWRRGLLFAGPPGNGKTHSIRALINELGVPCIYVRTFAGPYGEPPSAGVSNVYARARLIAPCVVVLEDLDTLIDESSRSFLLNELDGLQSSAGVLTIASTNWPEKLDPALVDRPSRFDRIYRFGLPNESERTRWLQLWESRHGGLRPAIPDLASATKGFSYAYLQEVIVAAVLKRIQRGGELGEHALHAIPDLKEQMGGRGGLGNPGFVR